MQGRAFEAVQAGLLASPYPKDNEGKFSWFFSAMDETWLCLLLCSQLVGLRNSFTELGVVYI